MSRGRVLTLAGLAPALLSALLLIFALPPFHFLLLPFVALVPLAVALGSPPSEAATRAPAVRLGSTFGLFLWGILLVWIPLVMGQVFAWAYPAYLALLAALAGFAVLLAWAVHGLFHRAGLPMALALPLAWVGVEWLRGHLPFGLSFPWLGLGLTLTQWPELLSIAEWTGESGVSFWIASVNGMLAGILLKIRHSRDPGFGQRGARKSGFPVRWHWAGLALLVLAPATLSLFRARTLALGEGPTVAVVGTDLSRELRRDPGPALEEAERQLAGHMASLEPGLADLILLPESMVPVPLDDSRAEPIRVSMEGWARALRAPLVVGALDLEATAARLKGPTNSAVLFSPEGLTTQRYRKVRLVPVMETGAFRRGRSVRPLSWRNVGYGPLICYESLFGGLSRRHGRGGAQVLLNLTSDVWFGDDQSWLRGIFLHQHPAHLVLRAVENRMPVARAANGGYSFLLDPRGRMLSTPVPPQGGVEVATLPVYSGTTLFTRSGDLMGSASALILFALLLWTHRPTEGQGRGLSA